MSVKRLLIWCGMLSKRLYKKLTFLLLLVLIPLMVIFYTQTTQEESGMLTIVLVREDREDPASQAVVDSLMGSSELILFREVSSSEEARLQVLYGKADAAWILPGDLEQKMMDFVFDRAKNDGFIQVLVQEKNVINQLIQEKLSGLIFEYTAKYAFVDYLEQNQPENAALSREELIACYESADFDEDLFEFAHLTGTSSVEEKGANYLLSPVRGIVGLIVVLTGLASGLYYMEDQKNGLFAWVPEKKRPLVELGYQLISLSNVMIVAMVSLFIAGLTTNFAKELVIDLLFMLCTACYCMLMRSFGRTQQMLGSLIPLLAILMLALSPVFFDFGALRAAQYLFPTSYFIIAPHNTNYILYMPVFCLVCLALYVLCCRVFKNL